MLDEEPDKISKIREKLHEWQGANHVSGTNAILKHPDFINPETPQLVWESSKKNFATNGCLPRSLANAIVRADTIADTSTENLCKITHVDPRCVQSCKIYSSCIRSLINGERNIDNLLRSTLSDPDDELSNTIIVGYTGSIRDLKLNDPIRIDYVFRALSCGIYALQVIKFAITNSKTPNFKKFITHIVKECGTASANGAVAGAVMGAYLGYSRLPADWIQAIIKDKSAESLHAVDLLLKSINL
jgi:ADP-ribosylglycohydrolase